MANLDYYLKILQKKWYEILKTIIEGECGCITTVTLVYLVPEFDPTCKPGKPCKNKEIREDVEIAVFFDDKSFSYKYKMNVENGFAKTITNKAISDKLMKASYIIINEDKYQKDGRTVPMGFSNDDDYKFFSIMWKLWI